MQLDYIIDFMDEANVVIEEQVIELSDIEVSATCINIPAYRQRIKLANNPDSRQKQQLKNELLSYYYDSLILS